MRLLLYALITFMLSSVPLDKDRDYIHVGEKIKGITVVAPPREYNSDPITPIKEVNANWVALVPYGFTPPGGTDVRFNNKRQWWGERKEGLIATIKYAQDHDMKVMIKPQVWMHGAWVGDMDFQSEAEWQQWEANYEAFILAFTDLAVEYEVEMLCIATEYKIAARKREQFFRSLIEKIRAKYKGKLVYSANWDSYNQIPFWDALDFIGISSYFPLSDADTPTQKDLLKKWRPIVRKLKKYAKKKQRPILFTEYGYLSVDGCAGKTWQLEKRVKQLDINEQAQSNAMNALFTTYWKEEFWAGGFLWKWFPEGKGHEGYPERDYTPQQKIAEETLSQWYGRK